MDQNDRRASLRDRLALEIFKRWQICLDRRHSAKTRRSFKCEANRHVAPLGEADAEHAIAVGSDLANEFVSQSRQDSHIIDVGLLTVLVDLAVFQ